jgi:hypothetical protein
VWLYPLETLDDLPRMIQWTRPPTRTEKYAKAMEVTYGSSDSQTR